MNPACFLPLGSFQAGAEQIGGSSQDVLDSMLGAEHVFQTADYRAAGGGTAAEFLTAGPIKTMLVRNTSGGTLIPGYAVKKSVAADGPACVTDVAAVATSIDDAPYWLVDPFVKQATIPANAIFHIILAGYVPFIAGEAVSRGDLLVPGTGGKLVAALPFDDSTTDADDVPDERWAAIGRVVTAAGSDGARGVCFVHGQWQG